MASEAILEHQISLGGMPLKLLRVFNRTPSISMSHVSTDMTAILYFMREIMSIMRDIHIIAVQQDCSN